MRSLAIATGGLLLGLVGIDTVTGAPRLTMGFPGLLEGIGLIPMALGLLVVSDVVRIIATPDGGQAVNPDGSSGEPRRTAAMGGAALTGSFLPLLALGLPMGSAAVLLIAALMMMGIAPGPLVVVQQPDLVWGVLATIVVAQVVLLVVIVAAGKLPATVARISRPLAAVLLAVACLAAFSINNSGADVLTMILFGALGYLLLSTSGERTLFLIGFVLAPIFEENLRRTLLLYHGQFPYWRAMSDGVLLAAIVLLVVMRMRRQREVS